MIPPQLVRRYAHNQQVDLEVADQEIVLHYALGLLNQARLVGRSTDGSLGPLLFKGGTALRKCLFGSGNFRWSDLNGLVPRKQHTDREMICRQARERFAILTNTTEDEQTLLADQSSHREVTLFNRLVDEAREMRLRLG